MFKKRLLTAILLICILLGVILISHQAPIFFFLVGNLFVFLGMREFVRMSDGIRGLGIGGALMVFSAGFISALGRDSIPPHLQVFTESEWVNAALFLIIVGLFIFQATRKDNSNTILRISVTLTGIIYVAWLFVFLPKINYYRFNVPDHDGRWYIFFLFWVVKVNDSMAYLIGSRWGTHKLIPRISPRKTVEGAVGGILAAGLAAIVGKFAFSLNQISWQSALTLGIVLGAVAMFGDLAESLLKRASGKKDSGRTLPGMGGILDLMDSIYFTAPLLYLYMKLVLKL